MLGGESRPIGDKTSKRYAEVLFGAYSSDKLLAYWKGELDPGESAEIHEELRYRPDLQEELRKLVVQLDDPGEDGA